MTSAPKSRSFLEKEEISWRGLVTMMRLCPKGRFSAHANCSARVQTVPTTMIAGVWIFACFAFSGSVFKSATIRLWWAVVPCSKIAAGVSVDFPACTKPLQILSRALTPMRNTSVPSSWDKAVKSKASFSSAFLCPVMIWTEEAKLRWVTGIPA